MVTAIIACEIGFWILILAGLTARYPLNMPRTGLVLLAATPVVDLLLLTFTVVDLRSGGEPNAVHGLAALYLGFSVVFGHRMIAWADRTYRRRIRHEDVPDPRPTGYGPKLRAEIIDFGRALLAAGIAAAILEICVLLVNGTPHAAEATDTLRGWYDALEVVLLIWLVTGPVWQFFSRPAAEQDAHR
ncbi:hypothetical protein [uncultured Corynebacterium sp.]|uniref:hypothetical protein n=1 Tax=uncultured Corynebacterium sp. TaxID=159447 RepID=UPI0025FBB090|nr:hypothetical protein [uncultured Corynebacterium sp.]